MFRACANELSDSSIVRAFRTLLTKVRGVLPSVASFAAVIAECCHDCEAMTTRAPPLAITSVLHQVTRP